MVTPTSWQYRCSLIRRYISIVYFNNLPRLFTTNVSRSLKKKKKKIMFQFVLSFIIVHSPSLSFSLSLSLSLYIYIYIYIYISSLAATVNDTCWQSYILCKNFLKPKYNFVKKINAKIAIFIPRKGIPTGCINKNVLLNFSSPLCKPINLS